MNSAVRSVTGSQSLSIGEVLAELRAEFPETTISKLRFLEAEGLVEPRRTPAGYRKYSREDLARLRYVLTAQRDHYLPLKVIRENLATIDQGLPAPRVAQNGSLAEIPASVEFTSETMTAKFSQEELLRQAGAEEAQLIEMQQFGLIPTRDSERFTEDDLAILTAAAGLARYGVEPRHLRPYRVASEREIGLFTQVLAPLSKARDEGGRKRVKQAAADLADLSLRLHAALVQAGLRTMVHHTLDSTVSGFSSHKV